MDILKEAKELAELFGAQGVVLLLLLSPFVWWVRRNYNVFLKPLPENEKDQERRRKDLEARRQWVENRSFEKRYIDLLGRGLDWVAGRLVRDSHKFDDKSALAGCAGRLFVKYPFTVESYDLTLRLALVYPILAFILAWMWGADGVFVGFQLLPDTVSGLMRGLFVAGIFVSVWFFLKGFNSDGWRSILFAVVAVAVAVAFAGAIAIVVAVEWLRGRLRSSKGILTYWICYNLVLLMLLVVVLIWTAPRTIAPETLLLPVFFGLLPLANAALDWLSLGFTRGLLYNIRHGHHTGSMALLWAGFDIVLALVFLFAIASLTTFLLAGVNAISLAVGGKAVMDLVSLFDGLKASPGALEYSWIHFMMLSTLIPTLLHFFIAGFAFVLILPNQVRAWILAQWDERDDANHAAFFYVSFVPILGLLGPFALLWGLWELLTAWGGTVGWGLLDWVRGIAEFVDPSFSAEPESEKGHHSGEGMYLATYKHSVSN